MKLFKGALLFAATLVAATAASAFPANLKGSYTLPMPQDLAAYASYPLKAATWLEQDGYAVFTYVLPEDLSGNPDEEMTMIAPIATTTSSFFPMVCHRTGSDAYCSQSTNGLACTVMFRNLGFDETKVNAFLDQKYGVSPETEKRKRAAAIIRRDDAVGTMSLSENQ